MRRAVIIVVAIVLAVALLSRMTTYTVRFTEAAVRTTFGRATEEDVQREAGIRFKWPDPIQSVTKYDTRSRFLQTQSQTQQTADNKQLVVEAFCTWRVANPLTFFQRFSNAGARASDHYTKAEEVLRGTLRSAMGEISRYRMGDLFSAAGASKLQELEASVLRAINALSTDGASIADYGIEVQLVGINRIVLPEETTKTVFESMKQERARLVKELESTGSAEATTITSAAEENARKIESFAMRLAADIRKLGDLEAQQYVVQMNDNPELAVFLKQIDFMKQALAKRITWIVDTSMPGFELFSPGAQRKIGSAGPPPARTRRDEPAAMEQPEKPIASPVAGEPS